MKSLMIKLLAIKEKNRPLSSKEIRLKEFNAMS